MKGCYRMDDAEGQWRGDDVQRAVEAFRNAAVKELQRSSRLLRMACWGLIVFCLWWGIAALRDGRWVMASVFLMIIATQVYVAVSCTMRIRHWATRIR